MTARAGGPLTGRHVLAALLGFFGVVLAVNGVFVYLALSSWTGLDTEDAYSRGLAYNDVLAAAEAQRALGWQVDVDIANSAPRTARIAFDARDGAGRAIDGLTVEAQIRRPASDAFDRSVPLAAAEPGSYLGEVTLPRAGNWDVRLVARDGGEVRYIVDQRAWIR
jgi:nitrogen fixation protein FixH